MQERVKISSRTNCEHNTLCVYQQCTLVQCTNAVVAKSEKAKAKKTKKAQFLEPAQWCSKLSCKALCALPRGRSSQGCDAGMPIQDNSIGTTTTMDGIQRKKSARTAFVLEVDFSSTELIL